MKKYLILQIVFVLFFIIQSGTALADKEQAVFAIQKAKSFVDKVKAKSEEMKEPVDALKNARDFIDQAEATMKNNTSMLGKLKKEAEPDILFYAEMAEISASIVSSRLEKINQEKENARLEKLIPDIEAKIKIITDKDAEIQRLTEELKKPRGSIQSMNSEIALLKKEKSELAEQTSRMKFERENLNGKLEALGGVLIATKKDLSEKTRTMEDLSVENRRLKDDLKALETQKGSDIVDIRTKLQVANRAAAFSGALGKWGYLSKASEKGVTLIIPRKDLIKMTPKGPMLAPGAERQLQKFSDLIREFPESRLTATIHGFGNPAKSEDQKATESMAKLLKEAFIKQGIKESAIEVTGAGSGSPLFSKSAMEENRRVEIMVSR